MTRSLPFLGRRRPQRIVRDRRCECERCDSEDASYALALQLEEEESYALALQLHEVANDITSLQEEFSSFEIAKELQREEEEQADKSVRRKNPTKEQVRQSLLPCQRNALLYVHDKARKMHFDALPALRDRIKSLGHEKGTLDRCLDYIRDEAPIVIHLKEETLDVLANDSMYRNLFETGKSGGKSCTRSREKWEKTLFGSSYNGCEASARPKYGCLNITGDIQGVKPARAQYGKCFLTLAPHVRHCTTFSDKDTGGSATCSLATNEYYAHVLARYPDADLISVLKVSRISGAPSQCKTYKEVQVGRKSRCFSLRKCFRSFLTYRLLQIHGPVRLDQDVQALSVPGKESTASENLKRAVDRFQMKTGCNVLWQDDLLGH